MVDSGQLVSTVLFLKSFLADFCTLSWPGTGNHLAITAGTALWQFLQIEELLYCKISD